MSTRYDARRTYQRTALDRHSATVVSLLLVALLIGGLVFAGFYAKAEVDAFLGTVNEQTGQWLSAVA
jgi:hypothetical protein